MTENVGPHSEENLGAGQTGQTNAENIETPPIPDNEAEIDINESEVDEPDTDLRRKRRKPVWAKDYVFCSKTADLDDEKDDKQGESRDAAKEKSDHERKTEISIEKHVDAEPKSLTEINVTCELTKKEKSSESVTKVTDNGDEIYTDKIVRKKQKMNQVNIDIGTIIPDGNVRTNDIKKVQVGKDQEKAQSEKDSHSKNRVGKKPN